MVVKETNLKDVLIIEPDIFHDKRGFFMESYSFKTFFEHNIPYKFVQDNHSYNKHKFTFRGLHYQDYPNSQTTLIRVLKGEILDIVMDIRKGSPTYGKTFGINLSSSNFKQLLIPKGFAHGFLTLTDNVHIAYKMDEFYAPESDRVINIQDESLNIDLGISFDKIIMSQKDKNALFFNDIENGFIYGENS